MSLIVDYGIEGRWRAAFAWSAERGGPGFCIRRFRRSFDLDSAPDEFLVSVSADSRYRLFVSGRRAGRGPNARTGPHGLGPILPAVGSYSHQVAATSSTYTSAT